MNRHEVEERLREAERKLEFVMSVAQATIGIGSPLDPRGVKKQIISFKDLYREMQREAATLVPVDPDVQAAAAAVGAGDPDGQLFTPDDDNFYPPDAPAGTVAAPEAGESAPRS